MDDTDLTESKRPNAAIWRRIVAQLLDVATVFFLLFAFVVIRIFWFMDSLSGRFDPQPWGRAFVATLTFIVMYAIYEAIFVSVRGQTPGMDQMNVRVEVIATAAPPGPVRSVFRWLLPGLLWLITPLWLAAVLITALWITALAPGRRAVHDLLTGTRVVVYDTDIEEEPDEPTLDRKEMRRLYGPRSFFEAIAEMLERPHRRDETMSDDKDRHN